MLQTQKNKRITFFFKALVIGLFLSPSLTRIADASEATGKSILDMELRTLSGEILNKKDFLGHFTVLYVFANWCISCHKSIPALGRLEIPVYGLSYKSKDDLTEEWLKKHGAHWDKVLWDPSGKRTKSLDIQAVPQVYLIDPNGKIIFHHAGIFKDHHIKDNILPLLKKYKK